MHTLLKWICLAAVLTLTLTVGSAEAASSRGRIYHLVSLKFKPSTTPEQIRQVEQAFEGLKKDIKVIRSLEWGTNVSPEKLNKGFTHAFVLTFRSEKDRDTYLEHPAHKAFGKMLGPVLEDVFVIDFQSKS